MHDLLTNQPIDKLTEVYLLLRERKKAFDTETKETAACKFTKPMGLIENEFLRRMNEDGLSSLPNDNGTPYTSELTSVRVVDWESVQEFIEEHGLDHWYVRKVSKEGVITYLEESGELPPGVVIDKRINVNVRGK